MGRITLLVLVAAACLVVAPAAFASTSSSHERGCDRPSGAFDFGLSGTIAAVDAGEGVLTVAVEHGSDGLAESVDVQVGADTCLFRTEQHCRTAITLSDIAVGDRVVVLGTTDESSGTAVYTAAVVCVRVPCFGLVGTVTAVDLEAGTLTVAVVQASGGITGTVDIVVNDDTRIVRAARARGCDNRLTLADVSVGEVVGVWGTVDAGGDGTVYTADRVCLRVARFGLIGSVTAVDGENGALTVAIDHASGDLEGSVEVAINEDTDLLKVDDDGRTPITVADIAEGDMVAVFGTVDSSGDDPVYTAHVVLDGVSADWLPRPVCKPWRAAVRARTARKGGNLRLRVRVADAMPGCTTATVKLTVKTKAGRTVAQRKVAALAVNKRTTVALRLGKSLRRGTYRIVVTSTDWAGNRQGRARTATLTVK